MDSETVGAYVYWTRPRAATSTPFSSLDWAVLVASVVLWRTLNGPVWLFTDRTGWEELHAMGLLSLWDQVDVDRLDRIPVDIQASAFWDIGKTVALNCIPSNGCILDLDLIIWDKFLPTGPDSVTFLHWEAPVPPWYPAANRLSTPDSYRFDSDINWNAPVCNTALICCPNSCVRNAFYEGAMDFARGNCPPGSGIAEMLFAGQRLLAHKICACAARPRPIVDYLYVPLGESRWLSSPSPIHDPLALYACEEGVPFTHSWQHKHVLRDQPDQISQFCRLLLRRCRERAESEIEPWSRFLVPRNKELD